MERGNRREGREENREAKGGFMVLGIEGTVN